jgi:hypothetical protein
MFRHAMFWECIAAELTKSRDAADATTASAIRQALQSPIASHRLHELQAKSPGRIPRIEAAAHLCQGGQGPTERRVHDGLR